MAIEDAPVQQMCEYRKQGLRPGLARRGGAGG